VCQEIHNVGVEAGALSAERARDFDEWVSRRLADWTTSELVAFERWLVMEGRLEFIPAVRVALLRRVSAA
jgi:hypothetical protein